MTVQSSRTRIIPQRIFRFRLNRDRLHPALGPVLVKLRTVPEGFPALVAAERSFPGVPIPDVVLERGLLRERQLAERAAVLPGVAVRFQVPIQRRRAAKQLAALRTDELAQLRMGAPTMLEQKRFLRELLATRFARKRLAGLLVRMLIRTMLVEHGAIPEGFAAIGAHERLFAGVPVPDVIIEGNLLRKGFIAKAARVLARLVVRIPMPVEVGKVFVNLATLKARELFPLLVDATHVLLEQ